VLFAVAITACHATPATPPSEADLQITHGYALLTDLSGRNKSVGLILIIKGVSEPSGDLVKEIGGRFGALEQWLHDNDLTAKNTGLPAVETAARNGIAAKTRSELLSKGGAAFEVHLLVTQEKSTAYAADLCRQLAARLEPGAHRDALHTAAKDFDALNQRVLKRLVALTND